MSEKHPPISHATRCLFLMAGGGASSRPELDLSSKSLTDQIQSYIDAEAGKARAQILTLTC
jgi:hypothetical protein